LLRGAFWNFEYILAYKFGYSSVEDMEADAKEGSHWLVQVFWTSLVHGSYL